MRIEISEDGQKLPFFKTLYEEARSAAEDIYNEMDLWYEQYRGSKKIDGSDEEAKVVRNITYELIESQVTSYIPNPAVEPTMYSDRNVRNAKSIETLLKNKRNELPFELMNDIDERYTPVYGGSVWLVEWDNSITTHNTVGDVKVSCLSPRAFTGQPYIYNIADMEYCFVEFETSKEDIMRKYGVEWSVADQTDSDDNADDKTATLYVCYYRNEDDKICEYVWSGETELLDVDDYYARKRYVCKVCGKRKEICVCEKAKYELLNEEYEELTRDIQLSDGSVIPAQSEVIKDGQIVMETVKAPATDDIGSALLAVDDATGATLPIMQDIQVPKREQTKLPFFTPDVFPIVIRKNTSKEKSLFGQSDCYFIRPQQQEANKLESRISEKLNSSGVYPIVPKDWNEDLDNSIFKRVFRAEQNEVGLFGRIDLQVDISRDIAQSERLYDQTKRILGISDSFQGQYDSSAQSGKAKQIQVQQSEGRLGSKRQMKNAAYADIDKIIFQYYLAYADEPRPAAYKDAQGRLQNVFFNRYDFIERDEAGEYYYNDRYMFSTDATIDVEKSRELLWQENRANFQQGAYGNPQDPQTLLIFWQNMERTHYPFASDNVERMKETIAQQQQMAQLQEQNAELSQEVETRAAYENYLINKFTGGNR